MYPVKQSTSQAFMFFAHDSDGLPVTGMSDGDFTKRISKNGGAFAAMTVTITEQEGGMYSFTLSTDHTNTAGILTVYFTHASMLQVNMQWRVEARLLADLSFPTTSGRSIDVNTAGHVGLDFDETSGTIDGATDITGISAIVSNALASYAPLTATQGNALAASLALTAYAPLTTTQGNALAASLALAAFDPPTNSEMLAVVREHSASLALTAFGPATNAQVVAAVAALNDITVADILAATADGSLSVQDALKSLIGYVRGRIVKASTAFTVFSQTSVALWVSNISASDRNIL